MDILLVHPGASTSTHDVYVGLKCGLEALGHKIWDYALDTRIQRSGAWLTYNWRRAGKKDDLRPLPQDILYHAGEELVARALRVMPDVVLVVSAMYLHPDVLVLLRRARLRVGILFTESPYDDEKQVRLLPLVNIAWTNERSSAINGIRYLPHAWNRDVHHVNTPLDETVPAHQVVFVGTGFQERIDVLNAVDWTGIDLGLYGSWDLMGSRNQLRKCIRGDYVDNAVTAQLYRRATIGLNLYRQSKGFGKQAPRIATGASLNPRAYELAALGCFTVSDYRAEVAETFGDLVPTFTEPKEVRPLLDRWLADDAGLARVRAQLPDAVAAHTWHARAMQIIADLQGVGIVASRAQQATSAPTDVVRAAAGG